MNKELEVLQEIKLGYICGQGATNEFALRENEREKFKIIESALKRNIELDKENIKLMEENTNLRERPLDFYTDVEKKLKALEIIKEHFIKIGGIRGNCEGKKPKNEIVITLKDLTGEEFDFLEEKLR